MIDCNDILISYEPYKNYYVPNDIYTSGEKDETKLIDKYGSALFQKNYAVLILKDDIVNSQGYGLKKGFYDVVPDKYLDFLYLMQAGKIKAKIPVINLEVFETINPEQQKIKKMSYKAYQKAQIKEQKKKIKGLIPEEIEYKEAQIHYIADKNAYIIIYNSDNIELTGLIKLD